MKDRYSPGTLLTALLLLAATLGGCGILGNKGPEQARLRLEGETGEQVRLITSSVFLSQQQRIVDDELGGSRDTLIVQLFRADTIVVTLPYEQTYNIRRDQRFFARMVRMRPNRDELHARLWVDGELKLEDRPNTRQDSLQFVYNFRKNGERPPIDV